MFEWYRMSRSARNLIVADHCPSELRPVLPVPTTSSSPPKNEGWCLHDFVLHKHLGGGSASIVYQAVHRRTGSCVALKLYFKARMTPLNEHQMQREVTIHARMVHPNIISMVRTAMLHSLTHSNQLESTSCSPLWVPQRCAVCEMM